MSKKPKIAVQLFQLFFEAKIKYVKQKTSKPWIVGLGFSFYLHECVLCFVLFVYLVF